MKPSTWCHGRLALQKTETSGPKIIQKETLLLPGKTYENHHNPSKNVLEGVLFDLLRRIGAPGLKWEFCLKPIFHFLGSKGGPKAAKERLGTPQGGQGGQKCSPRRPKIDQESSKTASGGHFCLRTSIYTKFLNFCMPKLQKNTCENRRENRGKKRKRLCLHERADIHILS